MLLFVRLSVLLTVIVSCACRSGNIDLSAGGVSFTAPSISLSLVVSTGTANAGAVNANSNANVQVSFAPTGASPSFTIGTVTGASLALGGAGTVNWAVASSSIAAPLTINGAVTFSANPLTSLSTILFNSGSLTSSGLSITTSGAVTVGASVSVNTGYVGSLCSIHRNSCLTVDPLCCPRFSVRAASPSTV
jgi:hypothetical protein